MLQPHDRGMYTTPGLAYRRHEVGSIAVASAVGSHVPCRFERYLSARWGNLSVSYHSVPVAVPSLPGYPHRAQNARSWFCQSVWRGREWAGNAASGGLLLRVPVIGFSSAGAAGGRPRSAHPAELADSIVEAGESAKTLNRPGMQRLHARLFG